MIPARVAGVPSPDSMAHREGFMAGLIYLDNAATSFPKPDVVHDTMTHFYRTCGVNPGRSGCDMALQAEAMVDGDPP